MTTPSLKNSLADANAVMAGLFVMEFASNGLGRIAASAGADFVVFDTEHTGWTPETISRLVATTRPTGVACLVRIPAVRTWFVSHALDAGASGVMVPAVESADEAQAAVTMCRYPPEGTRGAAFGIAHDNYLPADPSDTMRVANESVVVAAQIETAGGVRNADAIAAVDGVDVLWIGHNDLTARLGIPGEFDHPDYRSALDSVVSACRRHGKAAGFSAGNVELARTMVERGFRCIAFSDLRLFGDSLRAAVAAVGEHGHGHEPG